MTVGQILDNVQNFLGESGITGGGTWNRDILRDYLRLCLNEHAQQCWSLKNIEWANSFYGVQEYVLNPNIGQILSVRYYDSSEGFESRELEYDPKRYILDQSFSESNLDDPLFYYRFQDGPFKGIGLYPIPDKKPIFERTFTSEVCPGWTPVLDRSGDTPVVFGNYISLSIEESEDSSETSVNGTGLDPCRVYVSHIGLYLRREGHSPPGNITLQITSDTEETYYNEFISAEIPAESIEVRPNWYLFDFTDNPIELTETSSNYIFSINADADYTYPVADDASIIDSEVWRRYNGRGILVGTEYNEDAEPAQTLAFFQMHRFRNDIEVELYSNVHVELTDDDQIPETPEAYHHTHVKQVLEKAYMMGGHNVQLASYWGIQASQEMVLHKGQAVIPTLGDRTFRKRRRRRLPNIQYDNSTGTFSGRLGG